MPMSPKSAHRFLAVFLAIPFAFATQGVSSEKDAKAHLGTKRTLADLHGDPLPVGAIARMGTERLRQTGFVSSLAFSPDGQTLATAQFEAVYLWNIASGELMQEVPFDKVRVQSVAFAGDGRLLALVQDKTDEFIRLQDVLTGKILRRFPSDQLGRIISGAFSPDGKTIATGCGVISLWDRDTEEELRRLNGHELGISALAFSPDGKTIAAGHWYEGSDPIRLLNVETEKEIRLFAGHRDYIHAVAFSPDRKTLVSASHDGAIRFWEVATGKERCQLDTPLDEVAALGFSADGKTLALGGWSGSICLMDATTGKEISPQPTHRAEIPCVAFSPDGKVLASASWDRTVRLWDAVTGKPLHCSPIHREWVHAVAFAPDGKTLASGGYDKVTRIWDASSGKELRQFQSHNDWIWAVAYSPDGKILVAGGGMEGGTIMWEAATGKVLHRLPTKWNSSLAFSPDGKTLACGELGPLISLWDANLGKSLRKLDGRPEINSNDRVSSLAFSQDGKSVIAMADNLIVRCWETTTGKERFHWSLGWPNNHSPRAMALSPDDNVLATSDEKSGVCLWEIPSGKKLGRFTGHRQEVKALAFSPNGKKLASGSGDATILIWDIAGLRLGKR